MPEGDLKVEIEVVAKFDDVMQNINKLVEEFGNKYERELRRLSQRFVDSVKSGHKIIYDYVANLIKERVGDILESAHKNALDFAVRYADQKYNELATAYARAFDRGLRITLEKQRRSIEEQARWEEALRSRSLEQIVAKAGRFYGDLEELGFGRDINEIIRAFEKSELPLREWEDFMALVQASRYAGAPSIIFRSGLMERMWQMGQGGRFGGLYTGIVKLAEAIDVFRREFGEKLSRVFGGRLGASAEGFGKFGQETADKINAFTKRMFGFEFKLTGILSKMLFGIFGILGVLLGLARLGQEYSGYAKAMFKLLSVIFNLTLKPIADIIGIVLTPILVWFLKNILVPFITKWNEFIRENKRGIQAGGVAGALIGAVAFGPLGMLVGFFVGALVGGILEWLVKNVKNIVEDLINSSGLDTVLTKMKGYFNQIVGYLLIALDKLMLGLDEFFGWIINTVLGLGERIARLIGKEEWARQISSIRQEFEQLSKEGFEKYGRSLIELGEMQVRMANVVDEVRAQLGIMDFGEYLRLVFGVNSEIYQMWVEVGEEIDDFAGKLKEIGVKSEEIDPSDLTKFVEVIKNAGLDEVSQKIVEQMSSVFREFFEFGENEVALRKFSEWMARLGVTIEDLKDPETFFNKLQQIFEESGYNLDTVMSSVQSFIDVLQQITGETITMGDAVALETAWNAVKKEYDRLFGNLQRDASVLITQAETAYDSNIDVFSLMKTKSVFLGIAINDAFDSLEDMLELIKRRSKQISQTTGGVVGVVGGGGVGGLEISIDRPLLMRQTGGEIPETGLYLMHRGEVVIPVWRVSDLLKGGSQPIYNVSVSVSVDRVGSDIDIDYLAEEIGRRIIRSISRYGGY